MDTKHQSTFQSDSTFTTCEMGLIGKQGVQANGTSNIWLIRTAF